jgi:hypothetical protein
MVVWDRSKSYDEVLLLRESIAWNSSPRFRSMDSSALICAFIEPTDKHEDRKVRAVLWVSRWRFKHGKYDAGWRCLEGGRWPISEKDLSHVKFYVRLK